MIGADRLPLAQPGQMSLKIFPNTYTKCFNNVFTTLAPTNVIFLSTHTSIEPIILPKTCDSATS
jgi:hypothetical protein